MSKEAMKLALEALDIVNPKEFAQADPDGKIDKAITALREALAKPDFWEGYVPEPVKPATEESSATQAQQALDKKAENARELGLDYEPAQKPVTPCTHPSLGFSSLREDGAASRWSCVMCGTEFVPKATQRWTEFNETTKRNIEHAEWYLSTHPEPAQQVVDSEEKAGAYMEARLWEFIDMAAAWPKASPDPRTWDHVMVYAPKPAQRKPLTDEQREEIAKGWRGRNWTVGDIIDAIEAAHGIGEKK